MATDATDPGETEGGTESCWFCSEKVRGKDRLSCGSLKCLTLWDDMLAEEINYNERLIKIGIWKSITQRQLLHGDHLQWWERQFYTVKLWICCLFGWHKHFDYKHDPIDVVEIDFHKTYAGWDETWLRVGRGVLSNWSYEMEHDSEWNM